MEWCLMNDPEQKYKSKTISHFDLNELSSESKDLYLSNYSINDAAINSSTSRTIYEEEFEVRFH